MEICNGDAAATVMYVFIDVEYGEQTNANGGSTSHDKQIDIAINSRFLVLFVRKTTTPIVQQSLLQATLYLGNDYLINFIYFKSCL